MYRRLKNLLGVSLIILAIVLSQLPMEAVQADTATDAATEENTGDLQADVNTPDVGDGTDTTENEGGNDTKTDNENNGGNDTNTNNGNDDGENKTENLGTNGETDGETDTITPSDPPKTCMVTFDYGFLNLSPTTSNIEVVKGDRIQVPEDQWQITVDNSQQVKLEINKYYNIENVKYQFLGWYEDIACKESWNMMTDTVKEDRTLFASWAAVAPDAGRVFTIYFSANDSEIVEAQTQEVTVALGTRLVEPSITPTRAGYTFDSWRKDSVTGPEINLNEIPTSNQYYYAKWENREYTVTFDANSGKFTNGKQIHTLAVLRDKTIEEVGGFPSIDEESNDSCVVDVENWYIDRECLIKFEPDTHITKPITLYKKWIKTDEKGFVMNSDGSVLYAYEGNTTDVVIPSSVRIIASNAFSDMSKIASVTLPAGIADIKADAFSGAKSITSREIFIYASADGSNDSRVEGEELAKRYKCFTYVPLAGSGGSGGSASNGIANILEEDISCSLSEINKGIDDNSQFTYPKVTLPSDLAEGFYQMIFTELNNPTTIKELLRAQGYNLGADYVYYMDINLKKKGETEEYKPVWSADDLIIELPLPISWYGRDTSKIHMYTVNTAGTALEEVSISSISNNIFTFQPKHFSEFALVFTGSLTQQGGSNSGGGSGNGGSSGGSGGSGNSSSSSSSSSSGGSSSSGTGTTPSAPTTTPAVTTPNQPLPIVTPVPGVTQPVVTTPTGTGGNAGGSTAHVKDSTPKTGDPLEYRSLLVCCFFSIGVLLLLIGNKKKTSASSQYLQA